MKTYRITLFSLLMLCSTLLFAQQRGQNIESLHTAFITQKVDLTTDEAQKFWPIYDQYHADLNALKKQRDDNKETVKKAGGIDNMKDADVQKVIANETDIESRELELRKQYILKFETVISARKVAKFYIAEEEFKLYLLKQLGNNRRGGGGGYRREGGFTPQ
jgi:Skp family chaperone for outer membrane proteins